MLTLKDFKLETISPEELGEILINAKKAYYTGSKPIMDDATYDTLENLLRQKNPYHRLFTKVGSPQFDTGFAKKQHTMAMGSQNKVNTYTDLVKYFELKQVSHNSEFVIQPKCDGLSLEIEYKEGKVVDAITRGDGYTGDVITQNVIKMQNFKEKLKSDFTGSIRCEIVVTYDDFKKLNEAASGLPDKANNENQYSNPRNAAAGISQRLDGKYSEYCTLIPVDLAHYDQSQSPATEHDQVKLIEKLGLKPVDTWLCRSLNEVEEIFQKFLKADREKYSFDIDGLVIKINDLKTQLGLGRRDNRPKGQVAYKFPSRTDQTTILEINWQTGPLGNITPIAQVEPIEISGAVITFASLANYDLIKGKNINIGDVVEISRRGDVIPHIENVITKVTPGHINPPRLCPSCNTPLIYDHKFLRCPNSDNCPAQTLGALKLFCATLDIKGISDKTIEKLVAANKIKYPGDFYQLSIDDFNNLEGLGPKSGSNIINQIQAKRQLTTKQIFDAAIIPNFSAARIQQVIDAGFNTPEKILNLTVSQLEPLPGFQITLANKIVEGIALRRQFIESILSQVKIVAGSSNSNKLAGKSFAITGALSRPRKDIESDITANGGKVVSAVSQNTDYLITNETESDSAKFQAAKKHGVKMITEADLESML